MTGFLYLLLNLLAIAYGLATLIDIGNQIVAADNGSAVYPTCD